MSSNLTFHRYCACSATCRNVISQDMFCSQDCKENTYNYESCYVMRYCSCNPFENLLIPICIKPNCNNNCEEFTYPDTNILSYKVYCIHCYNKEP